LFEELGLVPERFHLGAWDVGESSSLCAGQAFHLPETAGEFGAGFLESDFRVDAEEAGEIDGDEEEVAELGFDGRLRSCLLRG
jgi:hypothetical protein